MKAIAPTVVEGGIRMAEAAPMREVTAADMVRTERTGGMPADTVSEATSSEATSSETMTATEVAASKVAAATTEVTAAEVAAATTEVAAAATEMAAATVPAAKSRPLYSAGPCGFAEEPGRHRQCH